MFSTNHAAGEKGRVFSERDVLWAAQIACQLEVSADKPGNVTYGKPFEDVSVEQFLASAFAIGPAFSKACSSRTGQLVLEAVRDTKILAGFNTNLGIVLLLAPLAKAALRKEEGTLRERLSLVLRETDERDTQDVYEAIRLASPGGLKEMPRYGVMGPIPKIALMEAMAEASAWDSIAAEYCSDFKIVFTFGLPALEQARHRIPRMREAVTHTFLTLLSEVPDTLISRKNTPEAAQKVSLMARDVLEAGSVMSRNGRSMIHEMDLFLRDDRNALNPGTTADLLAAVLFIAVLDVLDRRDLPETLAGW
ncbi:MAG: triphosphoribosyl-dephospho-CoA synthase [Thermovirgaceae bacterium]